MTPRKNTASALLLSRDLFFTSRIAGAAQSLGHHIATVDAAAAVASEIEKEVPRCIIVDLANRDVSVVALMQTLSAYESIPVVAFGAHVNAGRLQEARDAGCAEVLSKGRFASNLPEILKRYLGGQSDDATNSQASRTGGATNEA